MTTYLTYNTMVKGKKVTITVTDWQDPKDAIKDLIEEDKNATNIKASTVDPHPTPIVQQSCDCQHRVYTLRERMPTLMGKDAR